MSNIVENNNSFVKFSQVWAHQVFTDVIPAEVPDISKLEQFTFNNKDGTLCNYWYVENTTDNQHYNFLLYISNFQLTKEFRQGKAWKFELNDNEESIRSIILPGTTTARGYTPTFSNGEFEIPFTSVDPDFDLENCRINVGLDFEKLYFSGWVFCGKTLQQLLNETLKPPFDHIFWLLKNPQTGDRARFTVQEELTYKLPKSWTFDDTEDSNTLVSTNIFNKVVNKFMIADEGEYW